MEKKIIIFQMLSLPFIFQQESQYWPCGAEKHVNTPEIHGWMRGQRDRWTNRPMDKRTNGPTNQYTNRPLEKQTEPDVLFGI